MSTLLLWGKGDWSLMPPQVQESDWKPDVELGCKYNEIFFLMEAVFFFFFSGFKDSLVQSFLFTAFLQEYQ